MELNVLAAVLPAKAWWNEAPEQKSDDPKVEPAIRQMRDFVRKMQALNERFPRSAIDPQIRDATNEIGIALNKIDHMLDLIIE